MSVGACQWRGTPPSLAIRLFVLQASQEIPSRWSKGPSPPPNPAGEPSIALQGWSEAGNLPSMATTGKRPVCYHQRLNHGIAATLSTYRRDLATSWAINRAVLFSLGLVPCWMSAGEQSKL